MRGVRAQPKYSMQPAPSTSSASTVANAPMKPGSTAGSATPTCPCQTLSPTKISGMIRTTKQVAGFEARRPRLRPYSVRPRVPA